MSTSMSMKKAPNRPTFGRRPICQAGMARGWRGDGVEALVDKGCRAEERLEHRKETGLRSVG